MDIIRTTCFSHSEPFLKLPEREDKYQVVIRLDEAWFDESKFSEERLKENGRPGDFSCEVICFNLSQVTKEMSESKHKTLAAALRRVSGVFEVFQGFSAPPEMLSLPQWSKKEEIDKVFAKWCDSIFGQDHIYQK